MPRSAPEPEHAPAPVVDHRDPGPQPDAGEDGADAARERIVRSIGPKIDELRRRAGLSLQQLARRAGVSAAAIHKVERGDMVPTVTTLLKLAAALDRPVGYFVDGDGDPEPVATLVRAGDRPALPSVAGVDRAGVAGPADRFRLGGAVTEVAPGAGTSPEPHGGEELVLLLEGSLTVEVADERYTLAPGDALHYPADRPLRWHNPGDAVARAVWLSTRDG